MAREWLNSRKHDGKEGPFYDPEPARQLRLPGLGRSLLYRLAKQVGHSASDWPRLAIADQIAIDLDNWHNLGGAAGEETLVRPIQIIERNG